MWSIDGVIIDRVSRNTLKKVCAIAASVTNPTWIPLVWNLDLRFKKLEDLPSELWLVPAAL
jgi:hypothetical protein